MWTIRANLDPFNLFIIIGGVAIIGANRGSSSAARSGPY
jgi:hypothetical protein